MVPGCLQQCAPCPHSTSRISCILQPLYASPFGEIPASIKMDDQKDIESRHPLMESRSSIDDDEHSLSNAPEPMGLRKLWGNFTSRLAVILMIILSFCLGTSIPIHRGSLDQECALHTTQWCKYLLRGLGQTVCILLIESLRENSANSR